MFYNSAKWQPTIHLKSLPSSYRNVLAVTLEVNPKDFNSPVCGGCMGCPCWLEILDTPFTSSLHIFCVSYSCSIPAFTETSTDLVNSSIWQLTTSSFLLLYLLCLLPFHLFNDPSSQRMKEHKFIIMNMKINKSQGPDWFTYDFIGSILISWGTFYQLPPTL